MSKRRKTITRRDADRVPPAIPPTRTNSPPGVMTSAEALARGAEFSRQLNSGLDRFEAAHRATLESMAASGKVTK